MDKIYFHIVLTCFNSAGFRKSYEGVGLKACNNQCRSLGNFIFFALPPLASNH